MPGIKTVFFISIYGLTSVAGLMLADAEGGAFPQILTPPLAVLAYFLTDRTRKFHFPVIVANTLGILAFAYAGYQMLGPTLEARVLAGAHLVVYLTWIVLFQEKRLAQYWWMCALSVLQIAIGSILTNANAYGGMLVGFMVASIWTLSVMSLYQAHLQYGALGGGREGGFGGLGLPVRKKGTTGALSSLVLQPSVARGTAQLDPDERWLGIRFATSMLAVSAAALVVAAAFFLLIPRLWAGRSEWGSSDNKQFSATAMTGFTNEVRLGDVIPLLENSSRVLQVNLFDNDGRSLDVEEYCAAIGDPEPLFRGPTLDTYHDGVWKTLGQKSAMMINVSDRVPRRRSVRQQILMEPIGSRTLFAIQPVLAIRLPNAPDKAIEDPVTLQDFRPVSVAVDKTLSYDVYSPLPADAGRWRGVVFGRMDSISTDNPYYQAYRSLPTKDVPRLIELARTLTGYKTGQAASPKETSEEYRKRCIGILCGHLRDSGQYRYSLEGGSRDPSVDPVEDFLFNRKAGHCEYFASALALMLRAVDVPARLVSGFKGGTVNALSGAYEVEQRHAHVWVEAYLGDIPNSRYGRWISADPTPESREESVAKNAASIRTAHELASVVSSTWSRFMNMDIDSQQSSFYTPVINAVKAWWNPGTGQRPLLAQIIAGIIDFATDPTQWFTFKGIVVATLLGAAITGIVLVVRVRRRIWQKLLELTKSRRSSERIRIAFYERFESVCRQLGLARQASQTQREFAGTVGPRIRQTIASADGLPDLPPRVVDFFYRARFGSEELSIAVIDALNRDLAALEAAIRSPNAK